MKREDILKIYESGPDAVVDLISNLIHQVEELQKIVLKQSERIQELEKKLAKDSNNSSKPPSTDGFKKKRKSNRGKSKRKPGGQKGHNGHTLQLVDNPDTIKIDKISNCKHCGHRFNKAQKRIKRRQEIEIPPIELEVIEHQVEEGECPCCGKVTSGNFPEHITKAMQYGQRFRSLMVYLNQYQLIPYKRTVELCNDLFNYSFSKGTLYNFIKECYNKLKYPEAEIKNQITQSNVVHFDESGGYCNGSRGWFHVASNEYFTFFDFHEKRGREAMDEIGILPIFRGYAVHDFYASYLKYENTHILCNGHLLRELKFLHEEDGQKWAFRLKNLIKEINDMVNSFKEKGKRRSLPKSILLDFETEYKKIIKAGLRKNPRNKGTPGKRGRIKQSDARNLLDRLKKWKESYLVFMYDFNIPFDNNQAERDIRMLKVQQKISGCFRSEFGAKFFCRIRGYISTVRKNNQNVLEALVMAFNGKPFIPNYAE